MMRLPEIKQLDIATPIATYYATKRQAEQDQLNGELQRGNLEINRGNLEMNRMKLDEYKAQAPQRSKDAEMDRIIKAVSMDKEFMAAGEKMLLTLDPNDPEFQKKGIEAAVDLAKYAHSRGMPAEYAAGLAERMVKMYSPEATRQARIKAGYEKAPLEKIENGQYITVVDGNPSARKIPGYEKPPPTNSATATDIDDFVERANKESIATTGKPLTPGEQNQAALRFKRAQAEEVADVTYAKKNVESATAQQIKHNEELGKQLALVQTAPLLADAKGEVTPVQKKENGKRGVAAQLKELTNNYVELDTMGAIANIENNSMENLSAYAKSSGAGQYVGRMIGSRDQSIRDSINQIKPLLIQNIRAATEMGVRGMDSEKELQFYLQAATDEKRSIQANMAAIAVLDRAYGTGDLSKALGDKVPDKRIRELSEESKKFLSEDKTKPSTAEDYLKSIGVQ